jgi:hypothetical protein
MSTAKTFTISKAYILSAINKAGKRVYYDTDSHSGGYPYWSDYAEGCKRFEVLDKIPTLKGTDYMRKEVVRIEVLEVKLQAKIVQTTEMVSEAKAKAMAEIAKIEKELARKVAMLEGTQ